MPTLSWKEALEAGCRCPLQRYRVGGTWWMEGWVDRQMGRWWGPRLNPNRLESVLPSVPTSPLFLD